MSAHHYNDTGASERSKYRQKLRQSREKEAFWKINFFMVLLLLIALSILSNVYAKATQGSFATQYIEDDGRLSGDDDPATERCYMTPEEVEQAENEMIEAALLARATRIDNVTVTHYDCCVECCGKDNGITASGLKATPGVTVAVDPDVIPLGADVLVDYGDGDIKYYRADDVGGAVKGNHIDLCVSSHQEAVELGRKTATVWWVMPE